MIRIPPATLRPVALACLLAAAPPALHAQTPSPAPHQAARSYAIPPGPLGPALSAFAGQAGVSLSFTPEQTQGLRTSGLQGVHGVEQGFAQLLAGSGLRAVPREGGGYTLRAAPAQTSAPSRADPGASSATLATVTVTAPSVRNDGTTEGTGSYTQAGPSSLATGLGLSLRETPQSVSVMTRQRMDDFKLETLTEVMEQTPGVTVSRQNEMTTFTVRGSSANQQIDGLRQLANGWGVNSHFMYTLDDMAEIDRIEVLKGSSGLINGDGSYGGTINLVRKRPTRELQGHVAGSAGSWDTWRAEADLSGPLNAEGSLRGRLVAAHRQADGFRDHQSSRAKLLYGTVEYDLSPDTLLSAGVTYRDRTFRGSGITTPIQAYSGAGDFVGWMPRSFNNGARWAGYRQESLNLFARLEQRFAHGWTSRLQVAHEQIETPELLLGHIGNGVPGLVSYGRYEDIRARNTSIALDVKGPFSLFGREHELLVGAGAGRSRTTLLRGSGANTTLDALGLSYAQGGSALPQADLASLRYSSDLFSRKRRYVYTAGRFSLADPVKLIAGARVTHYDQRDVTDIAWYNYDYRERGVVTPYAGLTVDVSRDVSLYASYASIFQAQGGRDENQRTLPPEEGVTYELGIKGEFFDKRLNASASYFWMKTDNTAEAVGQTPDGETIYRAVHGATRRGYEVELSGELARGWQAQGSYVMNSSNLGSASTAPKHQFKLGTTYRFADGALQGLTLGAAARWQSAISTSRGAATLRQDAYWLFDLMARYEVNRQLSITANVNNAFDKRYFSGVTNFNAQGLFYTWGAPRSINVSMRYDF
jgi:outer membrane receptor for ferric coprogen and ferric-rhodotorulic acid